MGSGEPRKSDPSLLGEMSPFTHPHPNTGEGSGKRTKPLCSQGLSLSPALSPASRGRRLQAALSGGSGSRECGGHGRGRREGPAARWGAVTRALVPLHASHAAPAQSAQAAGADSTDWGTQMTEIDFFCFEGQKPEEVGVSAG